MYLEPPWIGLISVYILYEKERKNVSVKYEALINWEKIRSYKTKSFSYYPIIT